jgi:xylulokinase
MLWTREHLPDVYAQAARWMPVPAFLTHRLTGEWVMDYSIAARTLLFDQNTLGWSAELLERLKISPSLLPQAVPGGTFVGTVTRQAAEQVGLPVGTMCVSGGHDHLCAALAAGAYQPGSFVDSSGSANALLMLTRGFLQDTAFGLRGYASYASVLSGLYALKGGLKAAGSAIEWLARQLSPSPSGPDYAALEASARSSAGRVAGPVWLPHLIGSGTPQSDRYSRAAVAGMQMEHQAGDIFRGLLESLAFWTRQNVDEMQAMTGQEISSLILIGGVTRLRLLSELKASVTRRPVLVPSIPEAAATGAALLAGLGCGIFTSPAEASSSLRYQIEQIDPLPERLEWYDSLYRRAYLALYESMKGVNGVLEELNRRRVS